MWVRVDSVYEKYKSEATLREMLENAAESHTSGARFVGLRFYGGAFSACSIDFNNCSRKLGSSVIVNA
jgi:hypothetical protein